jgi:hypothetical protein
MKIRALLFAALLVITVQACSQTVVLKKNVGDTVLVTVNMETAEAHKFVGFDISYPVDVMAPIVTEGNTVAFEEGTVYAGQSFETLCTKSVNSVVVSKVLKAGNPVAEEGSVLTVKFVCTGHGAGNVTLTNMVAGYLSGGTVTKYLTTVTPIPLELAAPMPVTFRIEVK